MSDTLIIIIILAAFGLTGAWLLIRFIRRRTSSWRGTVIDKDFREHIRTASRSRNQPMGTGPAINIGGMRIGNPLQVNQSHMTMQYFAIVQLDTGKEIRWPISESLYQQINVGDVLVKPSGSTVPRIESRAVGTQPTPGETPMQPGQ